MTQRLKALLKARQQLTRWTLQLQSSTTGPLAASTLDSSVVPVAATCPAEEPCATEQHGR